jgi:hypothetical protein
MPAYWPNLATAQAGSRVAEGDERSELALDAADSRDIRSDSRFRFPRFSRSANIISGFADNSEWLLHGWLTRWRLSGRRRSRPHHEYPVAPRPS